jgi:hypothetical protein
MEGPSESADRATDAAVIGAGREDHEFVTAEPADRVNIAPYCNES